MKEENLTAVNGTSTAQYLRQTNTDQLFVIPRKREVHLLEFSTSETGVSSLALSYSKAST